MIITPSNDRRLRISATDWVKNGDRWIILNLTSTGGLEVRHVRSGRTVTLPADYVRTATELGYATAVHTAQGVTADTMHGAVTGEESRQQLYTMVTRGRRANHVYVAVVRTGTRTRRSGPTMFTFGPPPICSSRSWPVTLHRNPHHLATRAARPAVRLSAATARYLDALHLAAEHFAGPQAVAGLDQNADRLITGLTGELAWPTLRGHLLLLATAGRRSGR